MKKLKYFKIFLYVAIFGLLFFRAINFIDPDFGWHLATGNLILKSGFPKTDPFSYTMPTFSFIEHEWLVDVIFAKIYPVAGLFGVSVLFSALFLLSVFVAVLKAKKIKTALFIIAVSCLLPFFSNSPKIFSWLLFSLFTFSVLSKSYWKKHWLLTPFIIVLWTNLHGSFPLALVILSVVVISVSLREKRVWFKGVLATILGFLATFVNPYGGRIWWIVWLTISDPSISSRIAEWQPTYLNPFAFSILGILLFVISVVFILKYKHKFKTEELILNLLFFIQAVLVVRNIPYWVLINIPMVGSAIKHFSDEFGKNKIGKKRLEIAGKRLLVLTLILFGVQSMTLIYFNLNNLKEDLFYPKGAVSYLKNNLPAGQVYSVYNWGGYLIWKLPEKKVFNYGMMPVWRREGASVDESSNALDDSLGILSGEKEYKNIFEKYKIDTVLLPVFTHKNPLIEFVKKTTSFPKTAQDQEFFSLYEELIKDGWARVYLDGSSVILKKPISSSFLRVLMV